jgi:hypothetical protein
MGKVPRRLSMAGSGMRSKRTSLRHFRLLAAAVFFFGSTAFFWAPPAAVAAPALRGANAASGAPFGPLGSPPAAATGPQIDGPHAQFVFWDGSGADGCQPGGLCETYWLGTWSPPIDLHQYSGTMGSQPAVAVGENGQENVFWQGMDDNLWGAYWNGSWHGPICFTCKNSAGQGGTAVSSNGLLGDYPAVAVDSKNDVYVWWEGADRNLWEKFWTPSGGWDKAQEVKNEGGGHMGPLGGPPTAGIETGPGGNGVYEEVFWQGTDGMPWFADWDGLRWVGPYQNYPDPVMGTYPSLAYRPNGLGVMSLFWAGTGTGGAAPPYGALWYAGTPACEPPATECSQPTYAPMGSAPSAAGEDTGNIYVFWEGDNGYLWKGVYGYGQGFGGPYSPVVGGEA